MSTSVRNTCSLAASLARGAGAGCPAFDDLLGAAGRGQDHPGALLAEVSDAHFETVSAVLAGVKEIRQAVEIAKRGPGNGKRTILFVDEVHRFNKSQQDAFLPYVEDGTLIFIGATTENPLSN
jgi:putative ATPase